LRGRAGTWGSERMRMSPRRIGLILVFSAAAGPGVAHIDPVTGLDYRLFQRRDGGGDCCGWFDCRPATAPFQEPDGEKIMDRAGNKYRFDASKVVIRPSDDGEWHICGNARWLNCIIAPAES
jgi:hypothetical protein